MGHRLQSSWREFRFRTSHSNRFTGLAKSPSSDFAQKMYPSVDAAWRSARLMPSRLLIPKLRKNVSHRDKLLTHPTMNTDASMSVTTPIFRRHPWKNLPMLQAFSYAMDSEIIFGVGPRGLGSRSHSDMSVRGITIDQ